MKKILLFSAIVAFCSFAARADYYATTTTNCHPGAMRAALDDAVRVGRAVITDVICDDVRTENVVAMPAPMPEPVYVAPAINYDYIPVVDCVPGPIVGNLPPSDCAYCY